MKTSIIVFVLVVVSFFAGGWVEQKSYDWRISQTQELLQEEIREVDSLSFKFNQLRYIDLDRRLVKPFNTEVITKQFIDTFAFSYGRGGTKDSFAVDHTIKITRISKW